MINRPTHTPGRWIYYNTGAHQNGTPVYTLVSINGDIATSPHGTGEWLADIRMGYLDHERVSLPEGMANAHLMAAAPVLLRALRDAIDYLEKSTNVDGKPENHPILPILRSAIGAATL